MKTIITLLALCLTSLSFASELFIRVNRSGMHYATVSGQTIYNSSNIYRFFDLANGSVYLQVYQQNTNTQVFSSTINLGINQRVVGEIDQNGNLTILQTIQISTPNWYSTVVTNDPNQNGGGTWNGNGNGSWNGNGNGNGNGGWNGNGQNGSIDNASFNLFIEDLKKESFDPKRQERAVAYVTKANLSADQIGQILKTFTFDSYKVEVAKKAYSRCYDKQNYFIWKSAFSFESNYREVEEFVNEQ